MRSENLEIPGLTVNCVVRGTVPVRFVPGTQ